MGATASYANKIEISSDDTTYVEVDGLNSFSPSFSRELLETTKFKGASGHRSRIAGLSDYSAEMSGTIASAGYNSAVKIQGESTALTDEATTDAGDHLNYQITDASKRVLDVGTAVTVKVDAVAADADDYVVNPLTGTVTFNSALTGAEVVTISGAYRPLRTVATARSASISLARELLDKTVFGQSTRTRKAGLKDASGELGGIEHLLEDHDSVAASVQSLYAILAAGEPVVLELVFGGLTFRAFAVFESNEATGEIDGLNEGSASWQATAKNITGRSEAHAVGWFDDGTVDATLLSLLDAWEDGTDLYVKGTFEEAAASGQKGFKLTTLAESVELSAEFDGLVEFSATLQANGAAATI